MAPGLFSRFIKKLTGKSEPTGSGKEEFKRPVVESAYNPNQDDPRPRSNDRPRDYNSRGGRQGGGRDGQRHSRGAGPRDAGFRDSGARDAGSREVGSREGGGRDAGPRGDGRRNDQRGRDGNRDRHSGNRDRNQGGQRDQREGGYQNRGPREGGGGGRGRYGNRGPRRDNVARPEGSAPREGGDNRGNEIRPMDPQVSGNQIPGAGPDVFPSETQGRQLYDKPILNAQGVYSEADDNRGNVRSDAPAGDRPYDDSRGQGPGRGGRDGRGGRSRGGRGRGRGGRGRFDNRGDRPQRDDQNRGPQSSPPPIPGAAPLAAPQTETIPQVEANLRALASPPNFSDSSIRNETPDLPTPELSVPDLSVADRPISESVIPDLPPPDASEPELTEEEINASRIVQHDVPVTEGTFGMYGLSESILQCIQNVGFVHPTPIQAVVIPPSLAGKDLIGLAQTGSGKTAAFVIPMAERLTHGDGTRGLILCPTREIALQTKQFLDLFGKHHQLKTACVIGGMNINNQIKELREVPDIVVGTPGRLLDHLERRTLNVKNISEVVLDEADHMLDLGFFPQIQKIIAQVPKQRHTLMFSATMPDAIERLARMFMNNPDRVDLRPKGAAEGISHEVYMVDRENKGKVLASILQKIPGQVLVFMRRKIDADNICRELVQAGIQVEPIHSDLSQSERTQALQGFRDGSKRVLVATDIMSRGIDVPGITQIINFDIPENVEDYIHRAGRTARNQSLGTVSTIATWVDLPMIKDIESTLGKPIPRKEIEGVPMFTEVKTKSAVRNRPGYAPVSRRR